MNRLMNQCPRLLVRSAVFLLGLLVPLTGVHSQGNEAGALFQHGTLFGIGNKIYAYRVPVRLPNGKIVYKDIVVDVTKDSNGQLQSRASVAITASPRVESAGALVPGLYRADQGGTCKIENFAVANGRTRTRMKCSDDPDFVDDLELTKFTVDFASGTITPGHPYEFELKSSEVNLRADVNTYVWGVITQSDSRNYLTLGGCSAFSDDFVYGVQKVGNSILLHAFVGGSSGIPGRFQCIATLELKQS